MYYFLLSGGSIVESTQLRSKYLPIVFDTKMESLKKILIGQKISITVDESTDVCGRAAINILFSFYNETKLVKTEHLTTVNSTTIAQLVVKTLQFYNIPFENIILFISDNASYMIKAFNILSPLICQMRHNRCLAHILNLVGETWVEYKNFRLLDEVVMHIKVSFTQNNSRKRRWVSFLNSQNSNLPSTLPPFPVKTRWNSWFNFIFWINKYISQLKIFFLNEEILNNESKAIQKLAIIFKDSLLTFEFEILTMFITFNAQR
jgi:hypothetical protein